jgi:hypothetical protein
MKHFKLITIVCVFVLAIFIQYCFSQEETIEEGSTGKIFPKEVSFSYEEADYNLTATGTAVRKKFIFKVYGMVHYMQNAPKGNSESIFSTILEDNYAKEIIMDFTRDVGANKIKDAFQSGFEKNSTEEELKNIQPLINQFLGYFNSEVKKNEQYILRWLPNGNVISIVQGKEHPVISNVTFARILWTIWLGKDSIVNRDDLISFLVK